MKTSPLVVSAAVFVLFIAAEFMLLPDGSGHGAFWWSRFYGFFAIWGFVGCLAIIFFAKALGGHWLQRKENYYNDEESDE